MSYRSTNEGNGCLTLIIILVMIFFGPTILEFIAFILFMIVASILQGCSSLSHAILFL